MRLKKLAIICVIASALNVNICGCNSDDKSDVKNTTTAIETSSTIGNETTNGDANDETENKIEETEDLSNRNPDTLVENNVQREEKEDGSIFIRITDKEGKVLQTVEYDASKDSTIKYAYEYNEDGKAITEFDFEGPGNLVEEFLEGNYENATMTGENSLDVSSGYDVDLEAAFEVTIDELAPLYKKAEQLWDKYGVAVLIADKVSSYTGTAELCYDYKKIEGCLGLIEKCLECYPKDFFREFSGEYINATPCIQIVGTGDTAGVFYDGDEYKIVQIDVNDYCPEENPDDIGAFFCYTLHHEIGHMISFTMLDRADNSVFPLTEDRWNSFNPDDFEYVGYYDDEKESELFSKDDNSEYFTFSYACSTPEEDRAIIFGTAMNYYMGNEVMGFNDNIDAKLVYLSGCIKNVFVGVNWDEAPAWEKILDHKED